MENGRQPRSRAMAILGAWITISAAVAMAAPASSASPAFSFPRSRPEAQGVSSAALLSWLEALDRVDGMHSVMLIRHGEVVLEGYWTPYDASRPHELYSLSKSFTSTAVGFAVAEGRLSIDDEVTRFFPGEAPTNATGNLKAMRVRDLLTMSAGHQDEIPTAPERMTTAAFLAHPVPHKPGTHFKYNTPATFMLSAIVQQRTGQTVLEYLRPRLFEPLGIAAPQWGTNVQGISLGGYGLSVRTEDIARFGQFQLQRGNWQGRQLLPASWVDLATSRQVSNGSNPASDWDQGYGFQFWRCRNNAYRGDGAFGQYCVVLPGQDAVLAITSGVSDMQGVLNITWDKLLPAFHPKRLRAGAEARAAQTALTARLAGLQVRPAEGQAAPDAGIGAQLFGRAFAFAPNDRGLTSFTLSAPTPADPAGTALVVTLAGATNSTRLACGHRKWHTGQGTLEGLRPGPLAATVAWPSPETCTIKICALETPYHQTWTFRFNGPEATFELSQNVAFGGAKRSPLKARVQP